MTDYFEIDFLDVGSSRSGDAICLRYSIDERTYIHVVDAGFQSTGPSVRDHINKYYGEPARIDHVVATHPDGDHAGGLRTILEEFDVRSLWMLRPWLYAQELLPRFKRFTSVDGLSNRLREIYPNIDALEAIALDRGIPICEPFQDALIEYFLVLAPTKERYLDLIVQSDKTPEAFKRAEEEAVGLLGNVARSVWQLVKRAWGDESFSPEETTAENEMSVVQFSKLCANKILLTGDAGRAALSEAADAAERYGVVLPGIDYFQVPHHGSRRNVSTELLDRWLGERTAIQGADSVFTAMISASKDDQDHPRKAVVRAMYHRRGKPLSTKPGTLGVGKNAPSRVGWVPAESIDYPEDEEG